MLLSISNCEDITFRRKNKLYNYAFLLAYIYFSKIMSNRLQAHSGVLIHCSYQWDGGGIEFLFARQGAGIALVLLHKKKLYMYFLTQKMQYNTLGLSCKNESFFLTENRDDLKNIKLRDLYPNLRDLQVRNCCLGDYCSSTHPRSKALKHSNLVHLDCMVVKARNYWRVITITNEPSKELHYRILQIFRFRVRGYPWTLP